MFAKRSSINKKWKHFWKIGFSTWFTLKMKSKHGILCKDWNHVIEKDTLVLPFQSQLERNWIRLKNYCKPDAISNGIPIGTKNLPINCESAWDNQYQPMEKCYFNFLYISYLYILVYQIPITKSKEHPIMMKIGKYFVYIEKLAN